MSAVEVNKVNPSSGTDLQLGDSGDTITIPAGATFDSSAATTTLPDNSVTNDQLVNDSITIDGTAIALGGTVSTGTAWQSVTTGTTLTAVAGRGYWINTTSNACTITLPASASVGDTIIFADYARTWGTNAVTINQNSLNFQGATTPNPIYNTDGQSVTITYSGATQGWIPTVDDAVTYETPPPYSADFLVVAGGGGSGAGGNSEGAGGGGAGGFRTSTQSLNVGTVITVTVGDGGSAGTYSPSAAATSGSNSSISGSGLTTITSAGGGGSTRANQGTGLSGGSGGGNGCYETGAGGAGNTPSTSPSQGNNGGSGGSGAPSYTGGGGGGASAIGANGTTSGAAGNGGNGSASSITGTSVTYAGGGGGGCHPGGTAAGTGGTGGGGNGGNNTQGTAGTINTGGGAGGSASNSNGVGGGKGVVILSVPTANYSGTVTGSPTEATSGANKILTFTGSGSYTA